MKNSLESKLADAQNLNKNLQTELERVKSNQTATERQLRSELEISKRGDNSENEWKQRYEGLNKAHQVLQAELRQQQTTTREVKQEAAGFLNEMKLLSEQSQRTFEQERLTHQVHGLEEQVKEWKSRYARAKAQLRSLRTSSAPFGQTDFQQLAESGGLLQENGLVKDSHVIEYQVAINELLRSARRSELDSLLPQVRQVVITVRQISQEIGDPSRQETHSATNKLKSKVSATANNLITASKNFAASKGLSPVSLLDAAASHLSTAMVELIRVVKVRPSGAGEVEDEEEDNSVIAESPAGYYDLQQERISYGGESIYSSASSPRQANDRSGHVVQAKNPYQGLNHSPRDGVANGVKGERHNTKLGFGIRELEDEYEERH